MVASGSRPAPTSASRSAVDNALDIVHQIQAGNETDKIHIGPRALLGVSVRAVGENPLGTNQTSPADSGALVVTVQNGSAADAAGIQEGDVITSVGGKKIADDDGLHLALTVFHPGEKVTVGWIDASGGSHSESVTLKEGPPA